MLGRKIKIFGPFLILYYGLASKINQGSCLGGNDAPVIYINEIKVIEVNKSLFSLNLETLSKGLENNIFFPALVAHLWGIFLPSMLWRCINGHFLWIEINKTLIDRNFAQVSKKRKKCIEISPNAFQEWSKVIHVSQVL